jgi:hypothetical protein
VSGETKEHVTFTQSQNSITRSLFSHHLFPIKNCGCEIVGNLASVSRLCGNMHDDISRDNLAIMHMTVLCSAFTGPKCYGCTRINGCIHERLYRTGVGPRCLHRHCIAGLVACLPNPGRGGHCTRVCLTIRGMSVNSLPLIGLHNLSTT